MDRPSAGEFGELLGDLLRGLGEPQRFHRAFVMFGDHQISVRQAVVEQAVEVQRQLADQSYSALSGLLFPSIIAI